MKKIAKDLLEVANKLDQLGHYALADRLDIIAFGLHKTADSKLKSAMDAITDPSLQQERYSSGYPSFDGSITSDLEQINTAWQLFTDYANKFPEEANDFLETIEKGTKSLSGNINKLIGLQSGDKKEEQFLAHNKKIQKAASDVLAVFT